MGKGSNHFFLTLPEREPELDREPDIEPRDPLEILPEDRPGDDILAPDEEILEGDDPKLRPVRLLTARPRNEPDLDAPRSP